MFKRASDKKAFTAEDIERYHRGLLSAAERNALERAALEDALLEEALEGYAGLPPGQSVRDVAALKARLDKRVSGSNRALSVWWRVAAAVLILAGAGTVAYLRWGTGNAAKEVAVLARNAGPTTPDGTAPSSPSAVTPRSSAPADTPQLSATSERVHPPVKTAPPVASVASARPRMDADPPRILDQPIAASEAKAGEHLPKSRLVGADSTYLSGNAAGLALTTPDSTKVVVRSMGVAKKQFEFNFNNQVTDTNHQPISFATIKVLPAGMAVAADQNGFFHLSAADTQARIMVSAVGYEPRQYYAYELKNAASVQLSPSSTDLDEVVVQTLDVRKKAKEKFPSLDDSTTAQPEIGWGGYDDYLVNNLQLPDEAVRHHIHGEVDLSFQVDPVGKPVNISVVKSLCPPCDAEAVRLLERGPHWKKGTRSKKGKLKVHF